MVQNAVTIRVPRLNSKHLDRKIWALNFPHPVNFSNITEIANKIRKNLTQNKIKKKLKIKPLTKVITPVLKNNIQHPCNMLKLCTYERTEHQSPPCVRNEFLARFWSGVQCKTTRSRFQNSPVMRLERHQYGPWCPEKEPKNTRN